MRLRFYSAEEVERLLPFDRAMAAIEEALRGDVDPERDDPRLFSPAPGGEFLLMPAQGPRYSGLKALTVAPENPSRGLEKIQGVYLLFASESLTPVAAIDGASLTAIRTPAITVSALRQLAAIAPEGDELPDEPKLLVFGAGPQAAAHIRAALIVFPRAQVEVIGRRAERVRNLAEDFAASHHITIRPRSQEGANAAVASADIIVCASSSPEPLFDGDNVRAGALVAAVGAHGRELREVDDRLVARSDIVVEGRGSAERENGNLVSIQPDEWRSAGSPANLRDLARGEVTRRPGRPALFTGVGMSWEDLVCATAVLEASSTP